MTDSTMDEQTEPCVEFECDDDLREVARLVRVAMGRLGASISPWLDEGLLLGQGMVTLLEIAGDPFEAASLGHGAICRVVGGMRTWARATSWYRAALPCRIAPLCAALAERDVDEPPSDREIARHLGLGPDALAERYLEAGLVFGVSPELLLPERALVRGAAGLADAIATLPVERRRLLTLYFEDGLSFPEIAELLEISPERAQQQYGRAATEIRARVFGPRQVLRRVV